jgi:hypothetical protein
MKEVVIGVVATQVQAEAIVFRLHALGFSSHHISLLFPDERRTTAGARKRGVRAPNGAVAGGAVSLALGLLAGLGTLALPGLGPLIAAGPIMEALSAATVGATMGSVVAVLVGMGVSEYQAKRYEQRLRTGHVLVSVHTESAAERKQVFAMFKQLGAMDMGAQEEESCLVAGEWGHQFLMPPLDGFATDDGRSPRSTASTTRSDPALSAFASARWSARTSGAK